MAAAWLINCSSHAYERVAPTVFKLAKGAEPPLTAPADGAELYVLEGHRLRGGWNAGTGCSPSKIELVEGRADLRYVVSLKSAPPTISCLLPQLADPGSAAKQLPPLTQLEDFHRDALFQWVTQYSKELMVQTMNAAREKGARRQGKAEVNYSAVKILEDPEPSCGPASRSAAAGKSTSASSSTSTSGATSAAAGTGSVIKREGKRPMTAKSTGSRNKRKTPANFFPTGLPEGWPDDVTYSPFLLFGDKEANARRLATTMIRPVPTVQIRPHPPDGPLGEGACGLFATQELCKGLRLGDYTGLVTEGSDNKCSAYVAGLEVTNPNGSVTLFEVDAEYYGNEFRFINDATRGGVNRRPNVKMKSHLDEATGEYKIGIFVVEKVKPGEELLMAYGDDYWKATEAHAMSLTINVLLPDNKNVPLDVFYDTMVDELLEKVREKAPSTQAGKELRLIYKARHLQPTAPDGSPMRISDYGLEKDSRLFATFEGLAPQAVKAEQSDNLVDELVEDIEEDTPLRVEGRPSGSARACLPQVVKAEVVKHEVVEAAVVKTEVLGAHSS